MQKISIDRVAMGISKFQILRGACVCLAVLIGGCATTRYAENSNAALETPVQERLSGQAKSQSTNTPMLSSDALLRLIAFEESRAQRLAMPWNDESRKKLADVSQNARHIALNVLLIESFGADTYTALGCAERIKAYLIETGLESNRLYTAGAPFDTARKRGLITEEPLGLVVISINGTTTISSVSGTSDRYRKDYFETGLCD